MIVLDGSAVTVTGLTADSNYVILVDSTLCPGSYGSVLTITDSNSCASVAPPGPYFLPNPGSCIDTIYATIMKNTSKDTCVDTTELNGDIVFIYQLRWRRQYGLWRKYNL